MKSLKFLMLLFVFGLLIGCNPAENAVNSASTSTVVPSETPLPTLTLTATPKSTATETSIPKPTEIVGCPSLEKSLELEPYRDLVQLQTNVLSYLNAGGNPELLNSMLSREYSDKIFVAVQDLDGIPPIEVVAAVSYVYRSNSLHVRGELWVFSCDNHGYALTKVHIGESNSIGYPFLSMEVGDFGGTEKSEILVSFVDQVMSYCGTIVMIFGLDASDQWHAYLVEEYKCGVKITIQIIDRVPQREIVIHPDRPTTGKITLALIYDWEKMKFQLIKE